jgi:hypothetical protein
MVLPALFAGAVANHAPSGLNDLSAPISDRSGYRFVEVKL